jgi:hypothetical protein
MARRTGSNSSSIKQRKEHKNLHIDPFIGDG